MRAPGRRARRRRTAVACLAVAAALGVWFGFGARSAQQELTAARAALADSREALLDQRYDDASRAVQQAGRHTARARSTSSNRLWRAAAAVPLAGTSFAAVGDVSAAVDDIARQVLPEALAAAEVLDPTTVRRRDGSFDLARFARASPPLERASARLRQIAAGLAGTPRRAVLPFVDDARDGLVGQVDGLVDVVATAEQVLQVAPAILGADAPRRYFLLVQQTSESRGTGGLTGGYAVLEADAGRISVQAQGSNAGLRPGPVAAPPGVDADYLSLYRSNGALSLWQNVNLSADLPSVSAVVAQRWKAQGGGRLDGVIALDGLALSDILRGGGPLTVDGQRVRVEDLPQFLAVDQYRGIPTSQAAQVPRKDALADVAGVVSTRLASGKGDTVSLLRGIVSAVRSGHLRMTSSDRAVAPALRENDLDGALPKGPAPVAYAVVNNASSGKLDHFLDRVVRYEAASCQGPRRRTTITVALTNQAPARGLPPYLTIRAQGRVRAQSTDGAVVLMVYGTRGATLVGATLDGRALGQVPTVEGPYLSIAEEDGLPVFLLQVDLPRATMRTVALALDEPVVPGAPRVPEQPLSRPQQTVVDVRTCR